MTNEFISKLEEIVEAEELIFKATPFFGKYKQYLEHAVSHPAKMNTNLLEFLVEKFTKEGETILDPMAGTGSCGVVGALHNRNVVQVEIEPKFYEWMEKSREIVEKTPTLTSKGKIVNILGDARKLTQLLYDKVDAVITSPPYSETLQNEHDWERENQLFLQKTRDVKRKGRQWVYARQGDRYSDNPENIGNLPHGSIDAIITTPPNSNQPGNSLSHNHWGRSKQFETLAKQLMKNGKPTYLSEMLKVYRQMYEVLKPDGVAIVVVKPFIRNKKVVDLPFHTYILLSYCGFVLEKLYKLRLENQSFWRILYYKKFPSIPKINHEYVLVCRKPGD